MPLRRIRLAGHRGREATVLLVPRHRPLRPGYTDSSNAPVHFTRLLKTMESSSYAALHYRYGDPEALAQALIEGNPEIDMQAAGCETGPCDRVFTSSDGKPLYSTRMVEVVYDREGNETAHREPENIPANLIPDTPPHWSGKLIPCSEVARRYAFTRIYQVRHGNSLEFDFLFGLAKHLEDCDALALVGSGPKGTGPLILERNGTPMKGFLEGRVKGDMYLLVIHLASFELKALEVLS